MKSEIETYSEEISNCMKLPVKDPVQSLSKIEVKTEKIEEDIILNDLQQVDIFAEKASNTPEILSASNTSEHLNEKKKTRRGGRKWQRWKTNFRNRMLKLEELGLLDDFKNGKLSKIEILQICYSNSHVSDKSISTAVFKQ